MDALRETGSVAESCSALCSAAGKHLAAVFRGHAFAEAVLLGTMPFLRLIGHFHLSSPPGHFFAMLYDYKRDLAILSIGKFPGFFAGYLKSLIPGPLRSDDPEAVTKGRG